MRLTHASGLRDRSEALPPSMAAHPRWLLFVVFASTALLPLRALADDECAEPAKQVKALVAALNSATTGTAAAGRFDVRRLGSRDEAGRFQVTYLAGGKPVFSRRLDQQVAVSEHFHASASRKSAAVLELGYAFGARGGVSCEYTVGRSPVDFVARRRK